MTARQSSGFNTKTKLDQRSDTVASGKSEINNIAYDAMFCAVDDRVKIIDKAFLKQVLDRRELN